MGERTYTTFDISRIFDVYPTTVAKWIDEGKIKAFVTPGGHRRVKREDVISFLKELKMSMPDEFKEDCKKRILIVDDEESIIKVIRKIFRKFADQYCLAYASDGFQAGDAIHSFNPDLVILDIRLPGINGFRICKMIKQRENTSHMKILAITGYDSDDYREKILAAGADDYLAKPFDVDLFLEKTKRLLESE